MGEPKTLISMISGFLNASLSPKTNIICLRRPQDTLKYTWNAKKHETALKNNWKSSRNNLNEKH